MKQEELINEYTEVRECDYNGRHYLVRDNGAICRLPKENGRSSRQDNVWSFGTKNDKGYMIFTGNIRVHQVVCTAFHGPEPEPHMVVDHIDTNRCNNRPDNLQWLTRLENALNNPATRKKIIYLCGSIEAFIENPSILRTKALPTNVEWMRTVTKEEAERCKRHIDRWVEEDKPRGEPSGKGIDDWIFSEEVRQKGKEWMGESLSGFKPWSQQKEEIEEMNLQLWEEEHELKDSLTQGAKQLNWKTPTEFPGTPTVLSSSPLQDYLSYLRKGAVYGRNQYGDSIVYDAALSEDGSHVSVLTEIPGVTNYALSEVTFNDGVFIHESIRTFFSEEGANKYYTESLGKEWTGGEVLEDFC